MRGVNGDYESDFWEENPEFLFCDEYKTLKKILKKESSKAMWFIVYVNSESKALRDLREDKREEVVKTQMGGISDEVFAQPAFNTARAFYEENNVERPLRVLMAVERKFDEIQIFVDNLKIKNSADIKALTEALKARAELKKDYDADKAFYEDNVVSSKRGNKPVSPASSGEIFEDL